MHRIVAFSLLVNAFLVFDYGYALPQVQTTSSDTNATDTTTVPTTCTVSVYSQPGASCFYMTYPLSDFLALSLDLDPTLTAPCTDDPPQITSETVGDVIPGQTCETSTVTQALPTVKNRAAVIDDPDDTSTTPPPEPGCTVFVGVEAGASCVYTSIYFSEFLASSLNLQPTLTEPCTDDPDLLTSRTSGTSSSGATCVTYTESALPINTKQRVFLIDDPADATTTPFVPTSTPPSSSPIVTPSPAPSSIPKSDTVTQLPVTAPSPQESTGQNVVPIQTAPSFPPVQLTESEAQPAQSQPAQSEPAQSEPAQSEPIQSESVPAPTSQTVPVDTASLSILPIEGRPGGSTPVPSQPAQTQPIATQPAQTSSAESSVSTAETSTSEPLSMSIVSNVPSTYHPTVAPVPSYNTTSTVASPAQATGLASRNTVAMSILAFGAGFAAILLNV